MNLIPLPAFTDNYIWLLHDGRKAVVIDPGAAQPVLQALQDKGLLLHAILVTHHHHDHVDALGLHFDVLDVPGHTAGHIAFYCKDMDGSPLLFCGDTLFSGGCGRLFEGTPAQMLASLDQLAALPGNMNAG